MSHRQHQNLNETAGLVATPSSSVPGTPLVGCQDYAIVPNSDELVSWIVFSYLQTIVLVSIVITIFNLYFATSCEQFRCADGLLIVTTI